ncbi:unnamed protein product [Adineta ricciae]|uniref:Uncharacterized protein n=1 Tax=Adineta ricciae TaxID=249248 RepID=A0A813ZS81_ADIRI|nr:unnamed protein product [Adineta ricciae]
MRNNETSRRKQVAFTDYKPESSPRSETSNGILHTSMIVGKIGILTSARKSSLRPTADSPTIQLRRASLKLNGTISKVKKHSVTEPIVGKRPEKTIAPNEVNKSMESEEKAKAVQQKSISDDQDSLNETITSEFGTLDKIDQFIRKAENEDVKENQETLNLLAKIKQSASPASIGPVPLSQQACRFELPFDLRILEHLTPLDYLTKYCRLSSRRQYQFKRLFQKYRNRRHLFESSDLFLSMSDIHKESFTRAKYTELCQLLDLKAQEYEFTFETYAGILAFCERMLYNSSLHHRIYDDEQLTKQTIEKCDFDCLDRKLDGLNINEPMKRLLHAL